MRIVHVLASLSYGGSERVAVELAQCQAASGHQVSVIASTGPLATELERSGVELLNWPLLKKGPWALIQVPPLRHWLARERPDVLHLHARFPAWLAWLAWRSLPKAHRPALVTSVHGHYSVTPYSAIMVRGHAVIAVSTFIADYVRLAYPGVAPERVRTIPPGLDSDAFRADFSADPDLLTAMRDELRVPLNVPVLCLPGRLTRLKGHRHLLAVLARLKASGIFAIGLVLGGVPSHRRRYGRELLDLAHRLGVTDQLRWVPPQDDVRPWFRLSSLVLNVSEKPEAWGRTVPEAIALGVPVVGFDHGGVGANLSCHYPAGRVPPGDVTALADTIARLLVAPPPVPAARFPDPAETAAAHMDVYRDLVQHR